MAMVMSAGMLKISFPSIITSLAKWLSVRLRTNCLWFRILLRSLKLQIWRLLRRRSSLTFRQTRECRFTLKLVRDMITTYSHKTPSHYISQLLKIWKFSRRKRKGNAISVHNKDNKPIVNNCCPVSLLP